jgi:hypothetical protein
MAADGSTDRALAAAQIYKPLNPARNEIRLLRLRPARAASKARVICTLETVSLDGSPEFHALSYARGDVSVRRPVVVNGIETTITSNLHDALVELRARSYHDVDLSKTSVWIDALCINQEDLLERGHQVKLMREVFTQARRVLIWLGNGDEDSDWCLDMAEEEDMLERLDAVAELDKSSWSRTPASSATSVRHSVVIGYHIWTYNILLRPWWRRLWVIQELVLAMEDSVVLCGCKCISWSRLLSVGRKLGHAVSTLCKLEGTVFPAQMLPSTEAVGSGARAQRLKLQQEAATDDLNRDLRPTLLNHMRRGSRSTGSLAAVLAIIRDIVSPMVTDPRDVIYGLLGFTNKHYRARITVDYTLPVADVYQNAMMVLWQDDDIVSQIHKLLVVPTFTSLGMKCCPPMLTEPPRSQFLRH